MSQQEIKGNLARLLATENLVVEHRNVPTAQFDVDRRVLTLPNWDKASSIVYDMLVGHEVGHALFTPNQDPREFKASKSYVNVVEDVRIEKLMKRKYPGLRKSFNGGYAELNALDFFEIEDEDLTEFSLIDRINLHAKVGAAALIPFKDDEKVFVTRAENTETFEEVLSLAEDIQTFVDVQKEEELQNLQVPSPNNAGGGDRPDLGDDDTEYEDVEEDYQAPPQQSPGQYEPADLDTPSFEEGGGQHNDGETQEKFDRKTQNLSSRNYGRDITYVEIPDKVNLDKHIVDWKILHDWIEEHTEETESFGDYDARESVADVNSLYQEFRNENKKEVNYLVKEFEMRKSADAYARTSTARTGVLDTTRLHTYRHSEDLFKRINIVPDGKNHGMIFVLDWSGSMQYEILPTVKQLLNLTAFCKKVQIPFEVYAFTNEWQIAQRAIDNNTEIDYYGGWYGNHYREWKGIERGKIFLAEGEFHMVNFISSRSNPKDYERQCKNFFRQAYAFGHRTLYGIAPGLNLSGTPLNEAVVMLNYIIPKFKRDNDLQKVNACILTDGESNSASYGTLVERTDREDYVSPRSLDSYGTCVLRDRKTGIVYGNLDGYAKTTTTFIQQVRDRNEGVNVVGFRILPAKRLSEFVARFADYSHYEEVQKQWRKQKSAILPFPKGYSALYAISSKDLEDDSEFEVEESATKAQITRAFKKMLKSKSTNKKLLTSFVDQIA